MAPRPFLVKNKSIFYILGFILGQKQNVFFLFLLPFISKSRNRYKTYDKYNKSARKKKKKRTVVVSSGIITREKRPLGGGRKKKKDWRKLEGDKSKFNKLCIFASLPPSRPPSIPGSSRPWRPLNPQDSNQSDVTLWQVMTAHLSARTSSVCCP